MTEFSMFMPLQGIAPRNSRLVRVSLKDYNIIWKIKMGKMDRHGGNKTQRLYRCCFNYALIVDNGLRIYGEGRTQIALSSTTMICPLARI